MMSDDNIINYKIQGITYIWLQNIAFIYFEAKQTKTQLTHTLTVNVL